MIANFTLAALMVGLTVTVHFLGLVMLMWVLHHHGHRFHAKDSWSGLGASTLVVVIGLMVILTAEMWLYAGVYLAIGALGDLETALYFSITSFTTLGFGDVVLDRKWRLLGAIEGANGLLLFGWSTAFLFDIIRRLRTLEQEWLERADK
jgi:Ion channel